VSFLDDIELVPIVESEFEDLIDDAFLKFNPYHDPKTGRFTFKAGTRVTLSQVNTMLGDKHNNLNTKKHGIPDDATFRVRQVKVPELNKYKAHDRGIVLRDRPGGKAYMEGLAAQLVVNPKSVPPIVVRKHPTGKLEVLDGRHRLIAAGMAGRQRLHAVVYEG
jgi:hypothetical protein